MKTHIMVDLETMGNNPNSAIVAVGACKFNEHQVTEHFYQIVSLKSAMQCGGEVDADTILWWMQQSDAARGEIFRKDCVTILQCLLEFDSWARQTSISGIWGNGAIFDNVILSQSYKRLNMPPPWQFWSDRCYRTVKSLSNVKMQRSGTHHNALHDSISQAEHLIAIWKGGY